jgi:hypothetical protein
MEETVGPVSTCGRELIRGWWRQIGLVVSFMIFTASVQNILDTPSYMILDATGSTVLLPVLSHSIYLLICTAYLTLFALYVKCYILIWFVQCNEVCLLTMLPPHSLLILSVFRSRGFRICIYFGIKTWPKFSFWSIDLSWCYVTYWSDLMSLDFVHHATLV